MVVGTPVITVCLGKGRLLLKPSKEGSLFVSKIGFNDYLSYADITTWNGCLMSTLKLVPINEDLRSNWYDPMF